jgi:EpsD family peptidyl-prolyl cis-trans isomerase
MRYLKVNQIRNAAVRPTRSLRTTTLAACLLAGLALSACGGQKEKKPGQALVSVDGTEITVLQLNDELQRANVPAAQQEAASKQLLEALVDRQLLLAQAEKDKLDRDPKVLQAIERAKALIIAQSYLQKRVGVIGKPSADEVSAYFNAHPELFAHRKQFDLRQLVLETSDLTPKLGQEIGDAKSIDAVAARLDEAKVRYARKAETRSTADLPLPLADRMEKMGKTELLLVKEGARSVLIAVEGVKETPVTLAQSTPQIEQFLFNKKNKDAAAAEMTRLRATAKIDYLNKALAPSPASASAAASAAPVTTPAAAAPETAVPAATPAAPAAAPAAATPADGDATARGVAGLK